MFRQPSDNYKTRKVSRGLEISDPHTQEESQVGREDVHSGLVDLQTEDLTEEMIDPLTGLTTPDETDPRAELTTPDETDLEQS